MAKVDYAALAPRLLNNVGGEENIASMTHCATRMRFVLKDESKASTEAVKALDGVVTVVQAGGQYQVVIGPKVGQVYESIVKLLPRNSEDDVLGGEEERERPTTSTKWSSATTCRCSTKNLSGSPT